MSDELGDLTDQERKELGARLREAREYIGFSQEEVAKALKIPRTALSHMESGQRKVDALELKRMARLYERSVSYFTGDEPAKSEKAEFSHLERKVSELSDEDRAELEQFVDFLQLRSKDSRD